MESLTSAFSESDPRHCASPRRSTGQGSGTHGFHTASSSGFEHLDHSLGTGVGDGVAVLAELRPQLIDTENAGLITAWWFTRKQGLWRLRWLPAPGQETTAFSVLTGALRHLTRRGACTRWASTTYEPENHAFGGLDAMAAAHQLFHADSRHVLDYLASAERDRRRELGLLLCSTLLRGAGLDWYEQGDVWARVAAHRPIDNKPEISDTAAFAVHRLISAHPDGPHSPLRDTPAWPAAFQDAGGHLGVLTADGDLTRGLRAVCAQHVLFAWNRAGIPTDIQGALAAAAQSAVFDHDPTRRKPIAPRSSPSAILS